MKIRTKTLFLLLLLAVGVSACESIPKNLISSPLVKLSAVQVVDLGFTKQTFKLSFDVTNPNSFALPVSNVGYGVSLDGRRFASGETLSSFTVPANGGTQFAIRVDLDLLQTAPQLLAIIRDGVRQEIPYQLEGRFGVDIPFAPILKYRNSGNIRLGSGAY